METISLIVNGEKRTLHVGVLTVEADSYRCTLTALVHLMFATDVDLERSIIDPMDTIPPGESWMAEIFIYKIPDETNVFVQVVQR